MSSVQSGKCGTCGEEIQPHPLTGTTCACARRVEYDANAALEHLQGLQRTYGCIPGIGDQLNHDVSMLLAELERWKRALSDTRGTASTCLALNPTKEQMRRTLARIAGDE